MRNTSAIREDFDVPVTKIRTFRCDDELWEASQRAASKRRESVADAIRRALLEYAKDEM